MGPVGGRGGGPFCGLPLPLLVAAIIRAPANYRVVHLVILIMIENVLPGSLDNACIMIIFSEKLGFFILIKAKNRDSVPVHVWTAGQS